MTATAFLEQSQTFKVLKEQKSPKAKGSRVHLDGGGGVWGVCFQMHESAKDAFFYLFFYTESRSHPLLFDPQLISISS